MRLLAIVFRSMALVETGRFGAGFSAWAGDNQSGGARPARSSLHQCLKSRAIWLAGAYENSGRQCGRRREAGALTTPGPRLVNSVTACFPFCFQLGWLCPPSELMALPWAQCRRQARALSTRPRNTSTIACSVTRARLPAKPS